MEFLMSPQYFFIHMSMVSNILLSRVFSQRLKTSLQGFTLVELIVVVVILALLGTIGLVSFSGYSSGARDSTRVEDLANMQKSLAIYATTSVNGKYPLPDSGVQILNSGVLINTQGYAGKTTLANIKFNGAGLDPLDSQYYTYSTNKTQTGFALMAYLENASSLTLVSYLPSFQRAYRLRSLHSSEGRHHVSRQHDSHGYHDRMSGHVEHGHLRHERSMHGHPRECRLLE